MTTTNETTTTEKTIVVKPLYNAFIKSFNAEVKAENRTTVAIDAIEATGLTVSAFYAALWAEGVKIPTAWPLNAEGNPLSPSSKATKDAIPSVKRLVSALDMRKSRAKKAAKIADMEEQLDKITVIPEQTEKEKPATEKPATEKPESAPRVDDANVPLFDAVSLIESLQGFMIALTSNELELDENDAKLAHKLSKQLIEFAQKA